MNPELKQKIENNEISNIYNYVIYRDRNNDCHLLKNIKNKSKNYLTFVPFNNQEDVCYIINTNRNKILTNDEYYNVKIIDTSDENLFPLAILNKEFLSPISSITAKLLKRLYFLKMTFGVPNSDYPGISEYSYLKTKIDYLENGTYLWSEDIETNLFTIQLLTKQYKSIPCSKIGLNVKPFYIKNEEIEEMFNKYNNRQKDNKILNRKKTK